MRVRGRGAAWKNGIVSDAGGGIRDGVLDHAGGQDLYWGEVDRSEAMRAVTIAGREGWPAGARYLARLAPHLHHYIADSRRADFSILLPAGDGSVVWDCSCGFGAISIGLARLGVRVVATDPTWERIAFTAIRARQEGLSDLLLPVHLANILDLPVHEGVLDGAVLNGVLEYTAESLPHPEPRDAQLEVLRFVRSRLRDGGRLYVGIENRWGYMYFRGYKDHSGFWGTNLMPRRLADRFMLKKTGRPYRTLTYSVSGTKRLLLDAGFSTVEAFVTFPSYRHFERLAPYDNRAAFVQGILDPGDAGSRIRRGVAWLASHVPGLWRLLRPLTPELGFVATR